MSKLKSKLRPSKNVCKSVTKTAERKSKLRTSTKVQNEQYQRRQLFPMKFYQYFIGMVGISKTNRDSNDESENTNHLPAEYDDNKNINSTPAGSNAFTSENKPLQFLKLLRTRSSRIIKSLMIEYPNAIEKWFSQIIEKRLTSYWTCSSKTEEQIRNLEKRIEVLENQILNGVHHQTIAAPNHSLSLSQAVPIPPSMPPPPPPPPPMGPPPPPPFNAFKRQRIVSSNKPAAQKDQLNKNQSTVGPITLDVLKQVKLRKADPSARSASLINSRPIDNNGNGKSCMPLIDLGQLRSIKLKKTSTPFKKSTSKTGIYLNRLGRMKASELDENQPQSSTPSPKLDFRNHLKNTGVAKSPGGTPFCRKQQDCGEGFTPLLSRALKQKFQNAIPCESFSPDNLPMMLR